MMWGSKSGRCINWWRVPWCEAVKVADELTDGRLFSHSSPEEAAGRTVHGHHWGAGHCGQHLQSDLWPARPWHTLHPRLWSPGEIACTDLFKSTQLARVTTHLKPKLHIYACITQTTQMTSFRLHDSDVWLIRSSFLMRSYFWHGRRVQKVCGPAYDSCASSLAIATLVLAQT